MLQSDFNGIQKKCRTEMQEDTLVFVQIIKAQLIAEILSAKARTCFKNQ